MEHEIEIFTSGCYLCRETVEIVEKAKCSECMLTEYNLAEKCESEICLAKAKKYGIKATPTSLLTAELQSKVSRLLRKLKKFWACSAALHISSIRVQN